MSLEETWKFGEWHPSLEPGSTTPYVCVCLRTVQDSMIRVHAPVQKESNQTVSEALASYILERPRTHASWTNTKYVKALARVAGDKIRFQVPGPKFNRDWGVEFEYPSQHVSHNLPVTGPTLPPSKGAGVSFVGKEKLAAKLLAAKVMQIAASQKAFISSSIGTLPVGTEVMVSQTPPDCTGEYGPKSGQKGKIVKLFSHEVYGVDFPGLAGHSLGGLCPKNTGWSIEGKYLVPAGQYLTPEEWAAVAQKHGAKIVKGIDLAEPAP